MAKIGSLEPLLASKRITDSPFIKGGYFPIDKLSDLEDMRVATDTRDGTIVHGSLCYCREDGKFYQFNGESWVEAPGATLKMSDIDDELSNKLPEGRVYNAELHAALKNRYRVYTEKSVTDGGGVSPFNYMSANATADKLYNPIGYTDFNKMCADSGLTPSAAVENKHYIKRTVNGVTEYYSRLTSMVKRSYDDNVRTSTPVDSTDAVPYGYFKKYTFENPDVKNYQVVRRGSTGKLYSTVVDTQPSSESFALRTKDKELLADVTDSSPTKACVNKGFLNTVLSGYAKAEDLQKTVAEGIAEVVADAPAAFDTLKEMSDWIDTHSASAAEMNSAIQGKADSTHNHDGVYAKTSDIPSSLPASDVHAWAKAETKPTYTAQEVGAVPNSRTVNGKALSGDITLSASDVGALPSDTAIPTLPTISGTVSKGSGGISTGKVYNNASVATVLEDLLFPYVAPTGVTFSIYTENGTAVSGTSEYGKQITVTKAKVTFTKGSLDKIKLQVGTSEGFWDLYYPTDVQSGDFIEFNPDIEFDGKTSKTIYATITDGKTNIPRSVTVSYAYYNYAVVTNDTTKPTSPQQSDKVIWGSNRGTGYEADIPTQDNTYIWFLMPNTNKTTIQQYAMNQWNNMSTTYEGTVDFTTTMGKQVTYHAYRTDKLMSDTAKYRIN